MSSEASNLRVGLFVVGAAALITAGIVVWGGGSFLERSIEMETYFAESVEGLDVGAPFKYRGVEIGKVVSIYLAQDRYGSVADDEYSRYVVVRAKITIPELVDETEQDRMRATARAVKNGLRVRLASRGLTGVKFLESDYVDPDRYEVLEVPWDPDVLYVPSVPGSFTRIVDSVEVFMEKLARVDVAATLDEATRLMAAGSDALGELDLEEIGRETRETLASLNRSAQRIETLLADPELATIAPKLSAILDDVEGFTGEFDSEEERAFLDEAYRAIVGIREATDELTPAVVQIHQTMQRADFVLAETERGLGDIMAYLRATTLNLKLFSDEALSYPARTLWGDPPPVRNASEQ